MNMVKLKDVCTKIGSGATPRGGKEAYCTEGISLIRSQNVLDYEFSADGLAYINNSQAEKLKNVVVEEDDVLLNITGDSVARACIVEKQYLPARVNQHVCIIRTNKEKLVPSYLLYYLQMQKNYLLQMASGGATRNALTKEMISNLEMQLPAVNEQKHIVSILDDIEAKIHTNKKINNNLEQQAEAIFQSILSNAVTTVNLGEIADVKGGKRLPKGVNLIDIPNTHPYIRVRDLNNVLFASITPDYAYVDEETQKSISRYIVSTGDVLISIVGTIGLTAIVDSTLDKANLTENCVKVTNLKHITPEYLLLYLRSQLGREAITKGTVGAVQQKLPIKNIQAIPIPLLSEKDKNTLFCTLDSIFAEISSNVIQSAMLSSLRDTLLPRLMSGELDVSDIDL